MPDLPWNHFKLVLLSPSKEKCTNRNYIQKIMGFETMTENNEESVKTKDIQIVRDTAAT